MREVDVGRAAVRYFADLGLDVYQEVEVVGGIADIVATADRRVTVCECKVSLSWSLLAQARSRQLVSHWTWAAVPFAKRSDGRAMACRVFEDMGIGLLMVDRDGKSARAVHGARLNRRPMYIADLLGSLEPEHRTYADAGSAGGGRWTPFKRTAREVRDAVVRSPGIPLSKLVKEIGHHYSTDAGARAHITHWIKKGVIDGVELRRGERRAWLLYPEGSA